MSEGVCIFIENNWGWGATKNSLVAGIITGGQTINRVAAIVVDGPCHKH